jgi:YbbR-like protein
MAYRPWNNLGLKVLSLITAVILWAVVMGEQRAERVVSARLEFQDLPQGLSLAARSGGSVLLRLQGSKRLLAGVQLDEVAVSLKARDVREGNLVVPVAPADILGAPRGVEVVDISPQSFRLQLEAIVRREVQVQPRIEGAPGPGFVVRTVRFDPRAVKIEGPRSEVRAVVQAYTLPVSVEGRTRGFSARTALEPAGRQVQYVDEAPIQVSIDIGPRRSGENRGGSSARRSG